MADWVEWGTGTEEDPYIAFDWDYIVEYISRPGVYVRYPGMTYIHSKLDSRPVINMDTVAPDGFTSPLEFKCAGFDGDGLIIDGYKCDCADSPYCIKTDAVIKNVAFINSYFHNSVTDSTNEDVEKVCLITGSENSRLENVTIHGTYEGVTPEDIADTYASIFNDYLGSIHRLDMDLTVFTIEMLFAKTIDNPEAYSRKDHLWEYIHAKLDYTGATPAYHKVPLPAPLPSHYFRGSGRKSLFRIKKPYWFKDDGTSLISMYGCSESSILTFGHNDEYDSEEPFYYITNVNDFDKDGLMARKVDLATLRDPNALRKLNFPIKRSVGEL